MKMLKPLAFLILVVCTTFVVTECRNIQPNDANLIEQTCKKTPNYAICIKYLNSDPKARSADVTGLALIMVNVMKNNANIAVNKIHQLIEKSPPSQKTTLNSCASKYNAIVVADIPSAIEALKKGNPKHADIPSAIEALKKGNPKFAEQGANDAAIEANSCENGFSGKSPLSAENLDMLTASGITAAIVRNLL
ncbi:hypothetical protein TSUD_89360 [Trifolium subterraneum]|uniref:Pectinesterase inhibitor domain-containing protein n=1 Tax=Trifolium subterraneum TaxID=3900 RepID=A0A2Z6LRU2_TRISU|nr:hypothetical protein TSUD_89360 [Trifolium subterraneum]